MAEDDRNKLDALIEALHASPTALKPAPTQSENPGDFSDNKDGDSEGCLRLERLPTKAEATIIREALGIRRRRHVSAEALAALERARASIKSPQIAPAFVQAAPPLPGAA